MLDNLTYRKRNEYLFIIIIIFFILIYPLSISKTVDLVRNNIELKIQLEKANNAPKQIELLEKKLNDYETKLGFFVVEDNDNQEYLVRLANEFCQQNQLILREVPEHILEQENGLEIITTRITVQGEFRNLLKFLYYFEKSKISRIASVKYEKSEDYKTRKTYLAMHLLLQNIKIVSP